MNISSFEENLAPGTLIGRFTALDPDGDTLTYALHSPSIGLGIFRIAPDGRLFVEQSLDFETDAHVYDLAVEVSDPKGGMLSDVFVLNLFNQVEDLDNDGVEDFYDDDDDGDGYLDQQEITLNFNPLDPFDRPLFPGVETLGATIESGVYKLKGRIITNGGVNISEFGIVLTEGLGLGGVHYPANSGSLSSTGEFSVSVPDLVSGQTYSFRAYATNIAGEGLGAPVRLDAKDPNWWSDAEVYQGGWRINWLGAFLPNENGWIYHVELGWAYVESDTKDGLWMWMDGKGWVWSNPEAWPFLWSANTSNWLYPIKANGVLRFFDYSSSSLAP